MADLGILLRDRGSASRKARGTDFLGEVSGSAGGRSRWLVCPTLSAIVYPEALCVQLLRIKSLGGEGGILPCPPLAKARPCVCLWVILAFLTRAK